MLGDLVAVAGQPGHRGVGCTCVYRRPVRGMADVDTQYYVALDVADRPGVLAQVAAVFADHGVSIRSVQRGKGEEAQLVLVTHLARGGAVQQVLEGLRGLPVVGNLASAMRVEGEEADEVLGVVSDVTTRAAWPGLIERYRDRLPVGPSTPVVTLLEGGTPLVAGAGAVGPDRLRRLAEGRGGQPDRLVQGPGHDRGRVQGPGGGGAGDPVRLHRQHLGLGRRLRGPSLSDARW